MFDEVADIEFEKSAKQFLLELDPKARNKLIIAIDDLFNSDPNISWEFVDTALKKKSVDNWNKFGGGLLFNRNFKAAVYDQMRRNREAEEMDTEDYFSVLYEAGSSNREKEEDSDFKF